MITGRRRKDGLLGIKANKYYTNRLNKFCGSYDTANEEWVAQPEQEQEFLREFNGEVV